MRLPCAGVAVFIVLTLRLRWVREGGREGRRGSCCFLRENNNPHLRLSHVHPARPHCCCFRMHDEESFVLVVSRVHCAAPNHPHTLQADKGGEDAYCIVRSGLGSIGVADGVSGWAEEGIDPAEYSRTLMRCDSGRGRADSVCEQQGREAEEDTCGTLMRSTHFRSTGCMELHFH